MPTCASFMGTDISGAGPSPTAPHSHSATVESYVAQCWNAFHAQRLRKASWSAAGGAALELLQQGRVVGGVHHLSWWGEEESTGSGAVSLLQA